MRESQHTICAWALQTFGEAGSDARVAARANEEFAEFLRAFTAEKEPLDIAMEAADTVIVLYRLADRMGVVIDALVERPPWYIGEQDIYKTVATAAVCMSDVVSGCIQQFSLPYIADRLTRTVLLLSDACRYMSYSLAELVDLKMEINRARVWKVDGSGHGYHVREKPAAPEMHSQVRWGS